MIDVYFLRHPEQTRDLDISWIAALMLMNAFDANEAYPLFEVFVEQYGGALDMNGIIERTGNVSELLEVQDGVLTAKLMTEGVPRECLGWNWRLIALEKVL